MNARRSATIVITVEDVIEVNISVDLQALHHRIEAEAFAHARQAAGDPSLPIQLDLA